MKSSSKYFVGVLSCLALLTGACSNPSKKAEKIIGTLPENSGVLSVNLTGEEKEVIVYSMQPDSTFVVIAHSIDEGTTDSIAKIRKGLDACEAFKVEDHYIVVTREPRQDGKHHFLYNTHIVRNPKDKKAKTIQVLPVDDNQKSLASTGVVIDKEAKTITMSSYGIENNKATIYHTVYDFDGNRILTDPLTLELRTYEAPSQRSGGTYIWECQYCREKRNGAKRPSPLEFTCQGRGENPGFGSSHNWVKVGRID